MDDVKPRKPAGRPSIFLQELADEICRRLAMGQSLLKICKDDDMPSRQTVIAWTKEKPVFNEQYLEARDQGVDVMAEEVPEISDDEEKDPAHRRLQVDARKWYVSKIAPRRWGDRLHTEISGVDGKPIEVQDNALAGRLADLLGLAKTRKEVIGDDDAES